MNYIEEASKNFLKKEENLSKYATKSSESIRLVEEESDLRPAFFRDIDRIIHANSYTRYLDKTQVFTNVDNDMISKRISHVQMVSKIARTIGRALNLNLDLIEAIALGHDIGHSPFGHKGEKYLNDICILAYYTSEKDWFYRNFVGVINILKEIVGIKHIITTKATSIYK